jgi:hypothetical protein
VTQCPNLLANQGIRKPFERRQLWLDCSLQLPGLWHAMYDYAVIGGGIVGLSTAWQLRQRQPGKRIVVLEKEATLAAHQTGHNSGVIHAGIYYEPGSLKAELCRRGVQATIRFCTDNGVPFEQCGKLIVATSPAEHERMLALHDRALENRIDVELLDEAQLKSIEPNVSGVGAILSGTRRDSHRDGSRGTRRVPGSRDDQNDCRRNNGNRQPGRVRRPAG